MSVAPTNLQGNNQISNVVESATMIDSCRSEDLPIAEYGVPSTDGSRIAFLLACDACNPNDNMDQCKTNLWELQYNCAYVQQALKLTKFRTVFR